MGRPWTKAEIRLLGGKPDWEVGRRIGRPGKALWAKRRSLGIAPAPLIHRRWTEAEDQIVLSNLSTESARLLKRTKLAVVLRRSRLRRLRGLSSGPKLLTSEEAKGRVDVPRSESKEQEELVGFVGGPYRAAFVSIGGWLKRRLRGDLKVGGYTNALIPWPTAEGHARQFIICGDLLKALRSESRPAVSFHFGISPQMVSEYRRRLGIARLNPGSLRLFWRNVERARSSEAREKMSRKREGRKDLMRPADRERLRRIQRRPKPLSWRQKMAARWRRRYRLSGKPKKWTAAELRLIGTRPDREVAKAVGRSLLAVKAKKFQLLKAKRELVRVPRRATR